MKEIEILYKLLEDIDFAKRKIQTFSFSDGKKFKFIGQKRVIDTYYKSKTFNDLNPDENNKLFSSLRIREKDSINYITHKHDNFDDKNIWTYSDELETKIEDAEIVKNILTTLNFIELVKIDNVKFIFESENYEIVLERVENLGNFIEIEYKSKEDIKEVNKIKQEIRNVIQVLNVVVGEELNAGKPELMLRNKNS